MVDASAFAGRLKELREANRLTQPQLAERSGLTKNGIAQLEQGRRKPAWETVLLLAKALGVSCEAFTQTPAGREPAGPGRPRKEQGKAQPPVEEKPAAKPQEGRGRQGGTRGAGKPKGKRKG